jgi:hypothetical protein
MASRQRRTSIGEKVQEAISDAVARIPAAVWVILILALAAYLMACAFHEAAPGAWWLLALTVLVASGGWWWVFRTRERAWLRPGGLATIGLWFSAVWGAGGRWWGLAWGAALAIAAATWWLTSNPEPLEEGEDFWMDDDGHLHRQGVSTPLWKDPAGPLPRQEETVENERQRARA